MPTENHRKEHVRIRWSWGRPIGHSNGSIASQTNTHSGFVCSWFRTGERNKKNKFFKIIPFHTKNFGRFHAPHSFSRVCVSLSNSDFVKNELCACVRACVPRLWHNLQPTTNTLSTSTYFSVAWELAGHFDSGMETVGARKHSYFLLQFFLYIFISFFYPGIYGGKKIEEIVSLFVLHIYFVFCFIAIFLHRRR